MNQLRSSSFLVRSRGRLAAAVLLTTVAGAAQSQVDPDLVFVDPFVLDNLTQLGTSGAIHIADVNGDTFLDLIHGQEKQQFGPFPPDDSGLIIWAGDGQGGFSSFTQVPLAMGTDLYTPGDFTPGPRVIASGDLDGDGDVDLAALGAVLEVVYNDGSGGFGNRIGMNLEVNGGSIGTHFHGLEIIDMNGDGHPDIVALDQGGGYVFGYDGGRIFVLFNDGNGGFNADDILDHPNTGSTPDEFVTSNISVVTGKGSRGGMVTVDMDGDGDPDVVTYDNNVESDPRTVTVWLNDGNGVLVEHAEYVTNDPPAERPGIAAGDFDGDGQIDIVVSSNSPMSSASVFFGNGDGTLQSVPVVVTLEASGFVQDVIVSDVDGDGDEDFAVCQAGFGTFAPFLENLAVVLSNGDRTFEAGAVFAPTGSHSPNSVQSPAYNTGGIALGDLNGDGYPEAVMSPSGVGSGYVSDTLVVWRNGVAPDTCPGDIADDFGTLGSDGMVSFGDFLALLGLVGPCPGGVPGCDGDIADDFGTLNSGDGMVSFGDFLALLGLVGPC